jgi:hypothetical protein
MGCIENISARLDSDNFFQPFHMQESYILQYPYFGDISKLKEIHFSNCPEVLSYSRVVHYFSFQFSDRPSLGIC